MPKHLGRVLVVEDEDAIRLSLRDFLKRKGYDVYVASDGVGAIKIMLDHEIDIIVTDYRMDVLGGDYWIRFLHRYCADVQVIITSGFLRPEFKIPFDILFKPFDYSDLEIMIQHKLSSDPNITLKADEI
jgi:DNA-binding response OmpR family regulator